jgi:hypothetical protein
VKIKKARTFEFGPQLANSLQVGDDERLDGGGYADEPTDVLYE